MSFKWTFKLKSNLWWSSFLSATWMKEIKRNQHHTFRCHTLTWKWGCQPCLLSRPWWEQSHPWLLPPLCIRAHWTDDSAMNIIVHLNPRTNGGFLNTLFGAQGHNWFFSITSNFHSRFSAGGSLMDILDNSLLYLEEDSRTAGKWQWQLRTCKAQVLEASVPVYISLPAPCHNADWKVVTQTGWGATGMLFFSPKFIHLLCISNAWSVSSECVSHQGVTVLTVNFRLIDYSFVKLSNYLHWFLSTASPSQCIHSQW